MDEAKVGILKGFCESGGYQYVGFQPGSAYYCVECSVEKLFSLLENFYRDNLFWCDFLVSISGEHIPGSPAFLKLHYHLNSIPRGWKIHVICMAELTGSTEIPVFASATPLWKAAGWHERETAELFGVRFEGHPDLRKLLLPTNWEGFPLRKDYLPQEQYHGVKVKY